MLPCAAAVPINENVVSPSVAKNAATATVLIGFKECLHK
jgi:hypothetical protein